MQHPFLYLCSPWLPPGARPELNTEIVIGETDYESYAIMYYQKRGKITMKLYGGFLVHVTFVLVSYL